MNKIVNKSQLTALAAVFAMHNSCDPLVSIPVKDGIKGVKYVEKTTMAQYQDKVKMREAFEAKLQGLKEVELDFQYKIGNAMCYASPKLVGALTASLKRTEKDIKVVERDIKAVTRELGALQSKVAFLKRTEDNLIGFKQQKAA